MKRYLFLFYFFCFAASLFAQIENTAFQTTGTGFALGNDYIVTNYHVIDGATSINIRVLKNSVKHNYNAIVVKTDINNDLAILKIDDSKFKGFGTIPYRIQTSTADAGEKIFVLGYPLTSTMGEDIKLTDGIISSKTGFQGDVSLYQISAPVQPGNSGGPLFDDKGNVIGVVCAKHNDAENVGYAIKASYLKNLAETLSDLKLSSNNTISSLPLSEKVKRVDDFIFLITCIKGDTSNPIIAYNSNRPKTKSFPKTSRTIYSPYVQKTSVKGSKINSITLAPDYTSVEITITNQNNQGYNQWCSIGQYTYLMVDYQPYTMTRAEGIKVTPKKTYFSESHQQLTFTLYFPPIPEGFDSIDLIEALDAWNWYGINLK